MKNLIQKYMMAIVAVMMVVGFSAFKVVETLNDDPVKIPWYFDGNDPLLVTDEDEYTPIDPETCESGDDVVCEIYVPEKNGKPDLDAHIDPNDEDSPTYRDLIEEAMLSSPKTTNSVVISFKLL